jgi:hypothetical protein
MVVRYTGACLALAQSCALDLCWLRRFLVSLLRLIYHKYASMRHNINAMHGVQSVICCMIMSTLTILTPTSYLPNYP